MSLEAKQCDACTRYQPVAKQFQEQCLSLSKLQPPLAAPSLEPLTVTEQPVDKEEVIDKVSVLIDLMMNQTTLLFE